MNTAKVFLRLALRLIAQSLPESDTAALKILFQQLKSESRPVLTPNELELAMLNKGQKLRKLDTVELFRNISVNGQEEIGFLDFAAANMRVRFLALGFKLIFGAVGTLGFSTKHRIRFQENRYRRK